MTDSRPNALARRQILSVAEKAIRAAGLDGVLPTPLDQLGKALYVRDVIDMSQLPAELKDSKPKRWKRILGAYLYSEEVIFIDRAQNAPRLRFIEAHELGHRIIPWHRGSFQLDDDEQIFADTENQLEREAKLAGAHLIFQGRSFFERALDYDVTLDTPIALSDTYGVSMHVTMRYYVEQHPDAVALLIAGRMQHCDGALPIFRTVASDTFRKRYGDLRDKLATPKLEVCGGEGAPFGDIVHEALASSQTIAKNVKVADLNGEHHGFVAEAFFNQYNVFVMCSERQRIRRGRRIRVQAS